jgi:hypothetical protein
MALLKDCTFIDDNTFWKAFCVTEQLLADVQREQRMEFTLSTPEMMTLILDVHGAGLTTDRRRGVYDQLCGICGTAYEKFLRGYWVSRFLWFPALSDVRAHRFRIWARLYYIFMWLAIIVFVYGMLYTTNELFHYYHIVPMYVPLPAPHKVPRALEHGAQQMPAVVDKVEHEIQHVGSQKLLLLATAFKEGAVIANRSAQIAMSRLMSG